MKVVHALPFPGVGGTEVGTVRIMEAVAAHGVTSHALLVHPSAELRAYIEAVNVTVTDASPVPQPSLRGVVAFLGDSRKLAAQLQTLKPDLVHCADILAAYHISVACRMAGIPVLCQVRSRYGELPFRERFMVGLANHFAFVSQETRRRSAIRPPDSRASVIYDGIRIPPLDEDNPREVALEVRREFGLAPDTWIAGMFARVAPSKDYETLIRAAAALLPHHPKLLFLMVGDYSSAPEYRAHYDHVQRLLAEAGIADRFRFTGFRRDARRLMMASNVCLLPTNWEGLPLVLVEAMAVARPAIGTAIDGVPEVITDGVTGFLFPHGDHAALARHLATLLADPDLMERMGQAAFADVSRRFGWERFGREMSELYRRLTGERQ